MDIYLRHSWTNCWKNKKPKIALLSQRQLSDEDRLKVDSIRKRTTDAITTHCNKIGNDVDIDNGIASTGTEDSIEWTSALYKTLMELGKCALPAEPDALQQQK